MILAILILAVVQVVGLWFVWRLLDWRCRRLEKWAEIIHGDLVQGVEYRIQTAKMWVEQV